MGWDPRYTELSQLTGIAAILRYPCPHLLEDFNTLPEEISDTSSGWTTSEGESDFEEEDSDESEDGDSGS